MRLTSPFKARQPFTDKSRLRLDSRRLGGVLSQDHDLLPPPENEESRTSLGGVILSPEGPRSPLSPGGEQHVHHPHQGQRLPKDRSSLVRSATLNRLVQVALAQAESHGIPTDVDAKAALMSLPLSRDFRPESPPEPIVETRAQAASQPLPRTFHVGSPRPASSPNTRRRTGLLSRGRALSSAVEVPGDNADVGEKIMSGRHGPTPTPPAQPNSPFAQTSLSLPPIAQQPLSSKSNQQPSKRSLLARGRLVVSQGSSLVSEPLSFHPPALYGGVKMDSDDPNRLNEELHKLESNTFHSHRLQLPKIHTSRTARLSEGMLEDYIVRNDSFDW